MGFTFTKNSSFSSYINKFFIVYFYRCVSLISDDLTIDENNKLNNLQRKRKNYILKYNEFFLLQFLCGR